MRINTQALFERKGNIKMKQHLIFLIPFFILSSQVFGKCMARNDKMLTDRSNIIFIGTITLANFPTFKRLRNECKNKTNRKLTDPINLTYRVKPEKLLKGKIDLKAELELTYKYSCFRSVRPMYFEQDQEYIFAAKEILNSELKLVGLVCSRWGWDSKAQKSLITLLKTQ